MEGKKKQEGEGLEIAKPNHRFFKHYDNKKIDEDQSYLEKSQVLLVRHAFSMFNHEMSLYHEGKNQSQEAFMAVWEGEHLLDPVLHESGEKQALQQVNLMEHFTYRMIFVSPHRRTIQTAALMLSQHKQRQNIVFTLLPLAKENLHASSDLVINFNDLVEFTMSITMCYGYKFDFSLFEPYKTLGIDTWAYQQVQNEDKREKLMRECRIKPQIKAGLDFIRSSSDNVIEDNMDTYMRVQKLKEFINQQIQQVISVKALEVNEKILVFSHSVILRAFFSSGVDPETYHFMHSRHFDNCEIVPYHFDY